MNYSRAALRVITRRSRVRVNEMSIHSLQDEGMAQNKIRTFQMRTTDEFLAALDDWRAAKRPVLSRSEAIHRLVEHAIKNEARLTER
jgi:hypothetical protein